jgi:hypothetical protein
VSVVESVGLKFVILDAPNDSNVHIYLEALKKENVGHVVRVCDPSYDTSSLINNNIAVHVSVITFSRTRFFAVVVLLSRESCSCPLSRSLSLSLSLPLPLSLPRSLSPSLPI